MKVFQCGRTRFALEGEHYRPLVMGILNITPDSFSDGGKYFSLPSALKHAKEMIADGVDIIDIGAESSRPGSEPVPLQEELDRVIPVIKALKDCGKPLSIDTYKPEVMVEAIAAGADMIFLPIYYTPISLILTQANQMGYAPKWFGVDGMDGLLTVEGFDTSLAEGCMLLTPFVATAEDEATKSFVEKYQSADYGDGETPNQFAADAYDCVYAYKQALENAGATPDMSAEDLCDKMIEQFTSMTFDGLTGEGMTWDETGAVSKSPKGMVIENGAYVGM